MVRYDAKWLPCTFVFSTKTPRDDEDKTSQNGIFKSIARKNKKENKLKTLSILAEDWFWHTEIYTYGYRSLIDYYFDT